MARFTHLIFDLDGTLLHTLPELLFNMNETFAALGLQGSFTEEEMATFIGNGKDEQIRRAMRARGIPATKFSEINALLSVYYAQKTVSRTKPFTGVESLLNTLKTRNIPVYVATNKPEHIAIDVVNHFFANIPFLLVRGDKGDGIIKPEPAFLGSVIKTINTPKENILFIGDSMVDYLTAKNAGITCAIVAHGYDKSVFTVSDPQLIFLERMEDLLRLI